MQVEIKPLRSKSDFPDGYDQLVSGIESYYPFNVTLSEKDKMIIYSNASIVKLNISDILCGKEKISICVAIDSSIFSNESTRKVAVRSILKRIKGIKGFELFNDRIYTLPSGVINTLYKGDTTASSLAKEGVKEESETSVIEAFKEVCFKAFKEKASDIHFIADEDEDACLIQYRINGELEYADSPAYSNGLAMCRAAYSSKADASSRSDTAFNEKLRQDARIVLRFGEDKVAFRYASTPTSTGFLVVLRLLPIGVKGRIMSLEDLGYLPSQARIIESMMRKPIGAIIVAGVTGSGKSTTLKVLLEKKACEDETKRVITIEQPVEYKIQGAIQIPVTTGKNTDENPFEGTIKSGMRLDPDTIMAGEVRDGVTATLLASATESGHSVLTTIHAGSALEIISRLTGQSMKLPSDTVASMSFIAGLIYQKLVPVLCKSCRISLPVDEFKNSEDYYKKGLIRRLEMVVEDLDSLFIRNHTGCKCCRKGVTGVEVCAEVILPDLKLRNYWRTGEDLSAYEHWRSTADPNSKTNGQGRTALEVAIYKMTLGRLCPIGIEKSFGDINEDAVLEDGVRTYSEVQ